MFVTFSSSHVAATVRGGLRLEVFDVDNGWYVLHNSLLGHQLDTHVLPAQTATVFPRHQLDNS